VGQGDVILIIYENSTVMVDSGNRYSSVWSKINQTLHSLNVTSINLAIATHADSDHVGQFAELIRHFEIRQFWTNGEEGASQTWRELNATIHNYGIPEHAARIGETYSMGDASMVVLNPSEPLIGDQNSDSVVVKLSYRNASLVLTGDADWRAERKMLNSSLCLDLHADVLKLAHHGSRYSSREDFLDAVSPKVAVISCGYENPYGHPHNETLQRLIERNITYFRTDIHPELIDDIVATTDGYRLTIIQTSTGQRWSMDEAFLFWAMLIMLIILILFLQYNSFSSVIVSHSHRSHG